MYVGGNRLLDALPVQTMRELSRDLTVVAVSRGEQTNAAGGEIRTIDFPIDALISVVVHFRDGASCEVAAIGCDSLVEIGAEVDPPISLRSTMCHIAGRVARLPIGAYRRTLTTDEAFATFVRHAARARLFATEQLAACNAKHSVLQRCAQWLNITTLKVGRSELAITHEFLSTVLGSRRAGVTGSLAQLVAAGAVDLRRGRVHVRDRARLGAYACECGASLEASMTDALVPDRVGRLATSAAS